MSIEQLVQLESQNQAADQVSVSHSIASLRFLGAMDWREFVEKLSLVEQTLRHRSGRGLSRQWIFATRDRYRHAVEALARHSRLAEVEVARNGHPTGRSAAPRTGPHDRTAHVGFYLIDKGRPQLERAAKVRWPWRTVLERGIRRFPLAFYAGGIVCLTAVATALWSWQPVARGDSELEACLCSRWSSCFAPASWRSR